MAKIKIARSRKLLAYLIFIHSVMLVTLLSFFAMTWWSLVVTMVLLMSFVFYVQQHQWLKAKKSLVSIEYRADKSWTLNYSDESQKSGLKLNGSFVTPQLVMLYFKRRYLWQCSVVTIINDAVDAESFRQLRVQLRSPKFFQQ